MINQAMKAVRHRNGPGTVNRDGPEVRPPPPPPRPPDGFVPTRGAGGVEGPEAAAVPRWQQNHKTFG